MGRRLGIDFLQILVDLGRQVGTENPIRSDQTQVRSGQIRSDLVRWGRFVGRGRQGLGEVRGLPAMKGWVCVGNPIQILSVV